MLNGSYVQRRANGIQAQARQAAPMKAKGLLPSQHRCVRFRRFELAGREQPCSAHDFSSQAFRSARKALTGKLTLPNYENPPSVTDRRSSDWAGVLAVAPRGKTMAGINPYVAAEPPSERQGRCRYGAASNADNSSTSIRVPIFVFSVDRAERPAPSRAHCRSCVWIRKPAGRQAGRRAA